MQAGVFASATVEQILCAEIVFVGSNSWRLFINVKGSHRQLIFLFYHQGI